MDNLVDHLEKHQGPDRVEVYKNEKAGVDLLEDTVVDCREGEVVAHDNQGEVGSFDKEKQV